jgi:RNA polymerase sigma-70 factor (ECF subfamily)
VVVESKAPETLQEGFTLHYDDIRRFAYGRCGGSSVDDIASETFARAAAQWEQFDPRRGSLRAWLFGIATNVARESDRARRRQFLVSQRLAAQPRLEETPAAASEELDLVVSLLRRLPPKLRDVVLLVGSSTCRTKKQAGLSGYRSARSPHGWRLAAGDLRHHRNSVAATIDQEGPVLKVTDTLAQIRAALESLPPANPTVRARAEHRLDAAVAGTRTLESSTEFSGNARLGKFSFMAGRAGQLAVLSAAALSVALVLALIASGGPSPQSTVRPARTSTSSSAPHPGQLGMGVSFPTKVPRNFSGNYVFGANVLRRICADPTLVNQVYWGELRSLPSHVDSPGTPTTLGGPSVLRPMLVVNPRDVVNLVRILCGLPVLATNPYSYKAECTNGAPSATASPLGLVLFWSKQENLLGGATLFQKPHCVGSLVWPTLAPFPPSSSTAVRTYETWFRVGSEKLYSDLVKIAATATR